MARTRNSSPLLTAVVSGVAMLILFVAIMAFVRTASGDIIERSNRTTTSTVEVGS